MDAKQYIAEVVDPAIPDFETNPTSQRHAFPACVGVRPIAACAWMREPPENTLRRYFRIALTISGLSGRHATLRSNGGDGNLGV